MFTVEEIWLTWVFHILVETSTFPLSHVLSRTHQHDEV